MKRIVACVQIIVFASVFGCRGMMSPPPPLTFYKPRSKPLPYRVAIGKFEDKSFARYPLLITPGELREILQDELEKNRVFEDVFVVRIKKKDTPASIDERARRRGANLVMGGEISESECQFVGSNALGVPMYLLIATFFGFPIGFNIKAQTWEGKAEVIIKVRDLETGAARYHRRVEAVAYRNFSIWEERTERQLNRNYVRRMLTPLVLQNLKAAVARDFALGLKASPQPKRRGGAAASPAGS